MSAISKLERLTEFLSTVRGTDKAFMLTAYVSKILIWGLKKKGSVGLAERIANLASPVSDTRMLLRYYGLLPLIQWIKCVEEKPPASSFILWLYRAQNVANLFYYPLEVCIKPSLYNLYKREGGGRRWYEFFYKWMASGLGTSNGQRVYLSEDYQSDDLH